MRCLRCGEEVPEGSRFCIFCGDRIGTGVETSPLARGPSTEEGFEPPSVGGNAQASQDVWGAGGRQPTDWGRGLSSSGTEGDFLPEPFFLPPEADAVSGGAATVVPEAGATTQDLYEAGNEVAGSERTVAMSPVPPVVAPSEPSRVSVRTLMCPECYAENPVYNRFCHECGNPLPSLPVGGPQKEYGGGVPAGSGQKTAVLVQPSGIQPGEAGTGITLERAGETERRRWSSSFGPADILCGISQVAGILALTPLFRWKKGLEYGIFSHQGAYIPGSTGLFGDTRALGGPGILPYKGWEFLTAGALLALALGLAFVFLMVRAGRGPIYLLAGCISLFPSAYVLFQGILPLRQYGISIRSPIGLGQILFGGSDNVGLGPAFWISVGVGVLLILAGFIAPPRGWGRLFTFLVFFPTVILAAFFCAACYNWNLFIGSRAGWWPIGGALYSVLSPAGWV